MPGLACAPAGDLASNIVHAVGSFILRHIGQIGSLRHGHTWITGTPKCERILPPGGRLRTVQLNKVGLPRRRRPSVSRRSPSPPPAAPVHHPPASASACAISTLRAISAKHQPKIAPRARLHRHVRRIIHRFHQNFMGLPYGARPCRSSNARPRLPLARRRSPWPGPDQPL